MPVPEKRLEWIGGIYRDLLQTPATVKRVFGFALSLAQAGDKLDSAKPLHGFGGAGVLELIEDDSDGTYRAIYTVKFRGGGLCPPLLPKEEQTRDRHAETRPGSDSRTTKDR